MDLVTAYVVFCENQDIPVPSLKMRRLLRTNLKITDITPRNILRVHRIRLSIVKKYHSEEPVGCGGRFDAFCAKRGRVRPTQEQIDAMDVDPFEGSQLIRSDSNNPKLYRALVTFRAHGGF